MKTTSQKRAELQRLAKDVQRGIYDMLRLTVEILGDAEYVDQYGGEGALLDHLEASEFAHFGGSPSLAAMLHAYRHSPSRKTWEEYRYNVRAMIELAKPTAQGNDVQRTNWKALAKELQARVEQLEAALAEQRDEANRARIQAAEAMEQAAELRGEMRAWTAAAR